MSEVNSKDSNSMKTKIVEPQHDKINKMTFCSADLSLRRAHVILVVVSCCGSVFVMFVMLPLSNLHQVTSSSATNTLDSKSVSQV